MNVKRTLIATLILSLSALAHAAGFDDELAAIQHEWARINYEVTDRGMKVANFEALAARADAFAAANPGRAEPLVWQGIVLSTAAGARGGLGAMKLAKQAREKLEAAEAIDANVLNGSVYTSLGTLYAKVPGWPIGFGDEAKAQAYLEKALALNPEGIDPNYFYGEFLYDRGQVSEAIAHLEKALSAPARPGRADADAGRRIEVETLLARARSKAS